MSSAANHAKRSHRSHSCYSRPTRTYTPGAIRKQGLREQFRRFFSRLRSKETKGGSEK